MMPKTMFTIIISLILIAIVFRFFPVTDFASSIYDKLENPQTVELSGNYTVEGPTQERLWGVDPIYRERGSMKYTITFVANYTLEGVLLAKKHYTDDYWSWLSSYDLGIAWGDMSLQENIDDFTFSQPNRFTIYRYRGGPLSFEYIDSHMSNTHIIPANVDVERTVSDFKVGDAVRIEGYLVNIDGKADNGAWRYWHTSLKRNDRGDGACEVLYLLSAETVGSNS